MKKTKENPVSVNYYLADNKKVETYIHCKVSFGFRDGYTPSYSAELPASAIRAIKEASKGMGKYTPIKFSTDIPVGNSFWNQKEQKSTNNQDVNERLKNIREGVILLYKELIKHTPEIDIDQFKSLIKKQVLLKNVDVKIPQSITNSLQNLPQPVMKIKFSDFITQEINKEKKNYDEDELASSTIKHLEIFAGRIEKYEEKKEFFVHEITQKSIEDYVYWYKNVYAKENKNLKEGKYSQGSINNEKKHLKKYLRIAVGMNLIQDLNISNITMMKIIKKRKEETKPVIYLTVPELKRMDNVDVSFLQKDLKRGDENNYEIARSYFLLSAFAGGRRISDYHKSYLSTDSDGDFFLDGISEKTNTYTKVPCPKIALRNYKKLASFVGDKSKNTLPPVPNRFNKMIQEICQLCKINDKIVVDKKGTRKEKHTLITSHSARKSFASNFLFTYKLSIPDVMQLGGWSPDDFKAFARYVGLNTQTAYSNMKKEINKIDL